MRLAILVALCGAAGGTAYAARFSAGEPFSVAPPVYNCTSQWVTNPNYNPGAYGSGYGDGPYVYVTTCTAQPGLIYNSVARDVLFYSSPSQPQSVIQALQMAITPAGVAAKIHTATCSATSGTSCTQIRHNDAKFEVNPDAGNCGGLKPNACGALQNLSPGISSAYAGTTHTPSGVRFRPTDATLQNTIQANIINGGTTGTYRIGGFSEYVANSQCSEYFATSAGLAVNEGFRYVTMDYTTVFNLSKNVYDMAYELCREKIPGKARFCVSAGGRKGVCRRMANQAVNSFMNRCQNDYLPAFGGFGMPGSIHAIGTPGSPGTGVSGTPILYSVIKAQAGELTSPVCGDGVCVTGYENPGQAYACAKDCGAPPGTPEVCGDFICTSKESTGGYCSTDCGATETTVYMCGNGDCEAGESVGSCPGDCSICGDGQCTANESATCPTDCPEPVVCGDHYCANEQSTCPSDCPLGY